MENPLDALMKAAGYIEFAPENYQSSPNEHRAKAIADGFDPQDLAWVNFLEIASEAHYRLFSLELIHKVTKAALPKTAKLAMEAYQDVINSYLNFIFHAGISHTHIVEVKDKLREWVVKNQADEAIAKAKEQP